MINLLPHEQKKQLRAARTNVLLARYVLAMVFVLVALAASIAVTAFLLSSEKRSAEQDIVANQAKVANFSTIQAQAQQFRTNLSKAKSLFDQDINYAKVIPELSHLLPAGTAIDSLQLDSASFSKPLSLNVKVAGQEQAVALRTSFQSSPLVSSVSYGEISTNGSDATYPYTVQLNVTLNKAAAQ